MTFRTPKNGYAFPDAFMRPPVMAIGDSIYNGMRSATITAEMAAKSTPAGVSRVIDPAYPFLSPRYPEPLLIDIEQALRDISLGDLIGRLRGQIRALVANAGRWGDGQHIVDAPDAAWDNVSQAGAEVTDLIDRDWAYWNDLAADNLKKLKGVDSLEDLTKSDANVIDLHMALNAKFLLNPNEKAALKKMRPIDLVALRKPKHLLINIGANHGLIDVTLRGVEADPKPGEGLRRLATWPAEMRRLAEMLVELGPETETIHINTVPLPSTVPNMSPLYRPGFIDSGKLDKVDGFFPVYDNRIGGTGDYTQYSAAKMKQLDRDVRKINNRMIAEVKAVFDAAGDTRAKFFRLDKALKRYDGKHEDQRTIREGDAGVRLEKTNRGYSNRAIDFRNSFLFDDFAEGGLGSLDNHHPSGLGYSVMTRELLREMKKSIPDIRLNRAMISEQGDRMLLDEPVEFTKLISILYTVRRQKAGFHEVPDFKEANGGDLPPKRRAKRLGAKDADVARFGEMIGQLLRTGLD